MIKETAESLLFQTDKSQITIPRERIKEIIIHTPFFYAEKAFEAENYAEALRLYREYLKKYPTGEESEPAAFKTGLCYLKMADPEPALVAFEAFLKTYPDSAFSTEAALHIGEAYFAGNRKEKAGEYFQKALASASKSVAGSAAYFLFRLWEDKSPAETLEFCENYLKEHPRSERTPAVIYLKAEVLYSRAVQRSQADQNISDYQAITEMLEETAGEHPGASMPENILKLQMDCYERQARYAQKHKTLKKYADLVSRGDKEKAARMIREAADKLITEGEVTEAIILYRLIKAEYPETALAPEVCFQIAKILQEEANKHGAIAAEYVKECETLIQQYPQTQFAEEACFALAKKYQNTGKYAQAIEHLNYFLKNYPESKYIESGVFLLGFLYRQTKQNDEARKIWEYYLKKFPDDNIYLEIIKTYLRE
ncbi:MAG TPA: tetratricopeptide repeat protein [bacterium]|nr:tetratricopeptide repeat protein [bacterium]